MEQVFFPDPQIEFYILLCYFFKHFVRMRHFLREWPSINKYPNGYFVIYKILTLNLGI